MLQPRRLRPFLFLIPVLLCIELIPSSLFAQQDDEVVRVNTDLAKLQAVTAADVQRVMKKYFTNTNRLVIYYLPESAKAKTVSATDKKIKEHAGRLELGELARAGTAGKEQKRGGRAK